MRVIPTGPTTVTTEYQTFRNPESTEDVFQRAANFFEGIELEDYDLMNGVQRNLNTGVFVQGPLHAKRESGVVYFKELVKEELKKHRQREEEIEHEIWPAQRRQELGIGVDEEERFCDAVCGGRKDIEDWSG